MSKPNTGAVVRNLKQQRPGKPSVFQTQVARGQRRPAPLPITDWNNPVTSRAGFPRELIDPPTHIDYQHYFTGGPPKLPRLREAVKALDLKLHPGSRPWLGSPPSYHSISQTSSSSSSSLLDKERRETILNETIGGDYSNWIRKPNANDKQAVQDAAVAVTLNSDLNPQSKQFITDLVRSRLDSS